MSKSKRTIYDVLNVYKEDEDVKKCKGNISKLTNDIGIINDGIKFVTAKIEQKRLDAKSSFIPVRKHNEMVAALQQKKKDLSQELEELKDETKSGPIMKLYGNLNQKFDLGLGPSWFEWKEDHNDVKEKETKKEGDE